LIGNFELFSSVEIKTNLYGKLKTVLPSVKSLSITILLHNRSSFEKVNFGVSISFIIAAKVQNPRSIFKKPPTQIASGFYFSSFTPDSTLSPARDVMEGRPSENSTIVKFGWKQHKKRKPGLIPS